MHAAADSTTPERNEPNDTMTNEQPTPETDEEESSYDYSIIPHDRHYSVDAAFARKLERERDEAREALSGRTVSCSRCNEAGYKLAVFEAVEAGLRAENEAMRDETRNAIRLAKSAAAAAFNERDRLMRENERLHAHLDELTAATIHSCGDHCQRPKCVKRREMAAMREAINEAYDAIKASPYPDQQALAKLQPFVTDTP